MKIQADFFKTEQNNEPVRDFLKALSPEDKKSVGADIMAVEMLWPIGYRMVRKLLIRIYWKYCVYFP